MGSFHSRIYYHCLLIVASRLSFPIVWSQIVTRFLSLSNQRVNDLKLIYTQGQMNVNVGRQLTFLRLVKELQLTEEEWGELLQFLSTA